MKVFFIVLVVMVLVVVLVGCFVSNMVCFGEDGELCLYFNNSILVNCFLVEVLQDKQVGDLLYVQVMLENGWKFELDF